MLIKQKSLSLPRNLALQDFWQIANSIPKKDKSDIPPLFSGLEVLLKTSKNSNLDDSGISLPVFPSKTNLRLHNISVTPKMVKKVIMNLDSSSASGPESIPVVILKNCEPDSVHWGITPSSQKHHPLFLAKPPPHKYASCPSPPS